MHRDILDGDQWVRRDPVLTRGLVSRSCVSLFTQGSLTLCELRDGVDDDVGPVVVDDMHQSLHSHHSNDIKAEKVPFI